MKLIVEQSLNCEETEIKITCGLMDDTLKRLIEQIRTYTFSVTGEKYGEKTAIPLEKIYYFDSADNRTYIYIENDVYSCAKKLYELEEILYTTAFVRISKNCIVNTVMVERVKAQFSGRLEITLKNNEKLLVSKHYLKAFRGKFEL